MSFNGYFKEKKVKNKITFYRDCWSDVEHPEFWGEDESDYWSDDNDDDGDWSDPGLNPEAL